MAQILVVDDEIGIRELLSEILRDEGHDVHVAENAAAARAAREALRPDLVLLDIWMPDTDGVTLLREWAAAGHLDMPVVMMSGHATIDTAVEATKIGALDFLEKPIALAKLLSTVKRALEAKVPPPGNGAMSLALFDRPGALRDLRRQIEQIGARSRTLLLRSRPGGIVELVARTLHQTGKAWIDLARHPNPLTLDALAQAAGGVLFVEEMADMGRLQQKNLVFAADRLDKFDLRLIAATATDLATLSEHGWEAGILRRIAEVSLGVPALAELRSEIPQLAGRLLDHLAERGEVSPRRLSADAAEALCRHDWPGGFGELKSAVRSLGLGALDEQINAADVVRLLGLLPTPDDASGMSAEVLGLPLREARENFERLYFEHHLREFAGNMTRIAEKTGLERTHLYRKLKDLGLR